MLHSRKLNERINHIHERTLRIVDKDFNSSFQELLIEDDSLNIHHRNLQKLATEIFKDNNGLSPQLMDNVFGFIEKPYSLQKLRISGRGRSIKQNMAQKQLLTLAPNYGILDQMNVRLLFHLQVLR